MQFSILAHTVIEDVQTSFDSFVYPLHIQKKPAQKKVNYSATYSLTEQEQALEEIINIDPWRQYIDADAKIKNVWKLFYRAYAYNMRCAMGIQELKAAHKKIVTLITSCAEEQATKLSPSDKKALLEQASARWNQLVNWIFRFPIHSSSKKEDFLIAQQMEPNNQMIEQPDHDYNDPSTVSSQVIAEDHHNEQNEIEYMDTNIVPLEHLQQIEDNAVSHEEQHSPIADLHAENLIEENRNEEREETIFQNQEKSFFMSAHNETRDIDEEHSDIQEEIDPTHVIIETVQQSEPPKDSEAIYEDSHFSSIIPEGDNVEDINEEHVQDPFEIPHEKAIDESTSQEEESFIKCSSLQRRTSPRKTIRHDYLELHKRGPKHDETCQMCIKNEKI